MRAHRTAASRGPARAALGAAPGRGRRVSPHAGPTEHPFPCGRGSPCPAPWGSHPSRAAARSQPGPLLSVGAGSGGPHRTSLVSRPTGLSTTQVKLVRRSRALKELKSRSWRRTVPQPVEQREVGEAAHGLAGDLHTAACAWGEMGWERGGGSDPAVQPPLCHPLGSPWEQPLPHPHPKSPRRAFLGSPSPSCRDAGADPPSPPKDEGRSPSSARAPRSPCPQAVPAGVTYPGGGALPASAG